VNELTGRHPKREDEMKQPSQGPIYGELHCMSFIQFAPAQVTIYTGMLWGWDNIFFPVGNNIARLITGINGATSSVGSFETAVGDLQGSNFQDFSDFLDSSELAEIDQLADAQALTLPEPSTLALVGTGLVGLPSWVRGRAPVRRRLALVK
jgi:hypothetical protein